MCNMTSTQHYGFIVSLKTSSITECNAFWWYCICTELIVAKFFGFFVELQKLFNRISLPYKSWCHSPFLTTIYKLNYTINSKQYSVSQYRNIHCRIQRRQMSPAHTLFIRYILILSFRLRLGLPGGLTLSYGILMRFLNLSPPHACYKLISQAFSPPPSTPAPRG
jgi:hypothetical protein